MTTFKFRNSQGRVVTAHAEQEETARRSAMRELWGPETGVYAPHYRGVGLQLIDSLSEPA